MLSTTHYWGGDGRNQYSCDKHITVCMEMDIWLEDAADLFCFVPLPPSRHWDWEGLIDEHLPYLCSICRESRRALYPTIGTTMYNLHQLPRSVVFHAVTICDYGNILLGDQRVTKANTDIRQSGV